MLTTQTPRTRMETPVSEIPEHEAQALTKNGQMAKILLDDKCYFLRITRQGKLILTK